jgi:hypothetical protein
VENSKTPGSAGQLETKNAFSQMNSRVARSEFGVQGVVGGQTLNSQTKGHFFLIAF